VTESDDLSRWTNRRWHKLDFSCGQAISRSELQNLERLVEEDPNDCNAHRILLGHYLSQLHCSSKLDVEFVRGEYMKHLIWLIQNHPENEDLGYCQTIVNVDVRKIEQVWRKAIQDSPNNSIIRDNADAFFRMLVDKP